MYKPTRLDYLSCYDPISEDLASAAARYAAHAFSNTIKGFLPCAEDLVIMYHHNYDRGSVLRELELNRVARTAISRGGDLLAYYHQYDSHYNEEEDYRSSEDKFEHQIDCIALVWSNITQADLSVIWQDVTDKLQKPIRKRLSDFQGSPVLSQGSGL